MKKIILFMVGVLLLFVASCGSKLSAPEDFKVDNNVISFTEVDGAKTKAVIKNKETGKVYNRVVNNGTVLETLSLGAGTYEIYLEITLNNDKVTTSVLSFVIQDLNFANEVKGEDMVNSEYVKVVGRSYYDEEKSSLILPHSGSGFTVRFTGTTLKADLTATNSLTASKRPYIAVVVDGDFENPIVHAIDDKEIKDFILVSGLESKEHEIAVIKRSESLDSFIGVQNVTTDGKILPKVEKERFIEILGDSTIAGYGNETAGTTNGKSSGNSNVLKTFEFITAQELDADYSIVCASGWGLTGSIWTTPNTVNLYETYKRVYSTFSQQKQQHVYSDDYYDFSQGRIADVMIISVGTNDLYYIEDGYNTSKALGDQRKQAFIDEYQSVLEFISSIHPGVEIFMVYGAMGETRMYPTVEAAFANVKDTMSNVHLVKLNGDQQAVDHHPSTKSHEEMSKVLISEIKKIMNW